jgi:hypothetical protein
MNQLERKRKQLEQVAKIIGLLIIGFVVYPFVFLAIQGLLALIVAGVIAALTLTFLPAISMKFANWRLKAMKYEATINPVETLENQFVQREKDLARFLETIRTFHNEVLNFRSEYTDFKEKYPDQPDKFAEPYKKLVQLFELRKAKYKKAQSDLVKFGEMIDHKRAEWRVAQAAAKLSSAANAGEDFITKLMTDTAVTAIQSSMNSAFADLETSILNESIEVEAEVVSTKSNKADPLGIEAPAFEIDTLNVRNTEKEKVTLPR